MNKIKRQSYTDKKSGIFGATLKRKLEIVMAVFLLFFAALLGRKGAEMVFGTKIEKGEICVCIDAGHGGGDPGKIGINQEQEKDINLQISYKLKSVLEQQDVTVVMTRTSDEDLADKGVENVKVSDMQNRVAAIEKSGAALTVSIHQNSYPDESVHGAQVFYYGESAEGQQLAEIMQESLKQRLDPENNRQAKANDSYYMLKKTPTPTVIVECGFLSNYEEANLLCEETYQEQVAWAIAMGVIQYLNQ